MPSTRTDITAETVKEAVRLAVKSTDSSIITDWFDNRQHYLQLRQRGKSVTWFVRARRRTEKIGLAVMPAGSFDRNGYLTVREAREKAATVFAGIEPPAAPDAPAPAWSWADLDREYQASLKVKRVVGRKVKLPSEGSQDDVRRSFNKPSIQSLGPTALTALKPIDVTRAIRAIHENNGHRAAEKALTYVKSALTWALGKRGEESGLGETMPWWQSIRAPDPTATQIDEMQERHKTRVAAKAAFGVDHLGELLAIHEEYCAGKIGEEKVSPGVRWGFWWLCYTANRRASTVALQRDRLSQTDEFGKTGWGRATWPPEDMKAQMDFWLPVPPSAMHVANSAISDWSSLVMRSTGDLRTKWVFASTRRVGRIADNPDVAVYPSSLNAHIRALRGDKGTTGDDLIGHLPHFWLHLVRSVATNFLENVPGLPPAAVSAILSHADKKTDDQLAPTTKAFYSTNQKMELKAAAMEAWVEAIDKAFAKAGGKPPMPAEPPVNPLLLAR